MPKYWHSLDSRISRRQCYFTVATALGVVLLLQLLAISQLADIQKPLTIHMAIVCEKYEAGRLDTLVQAAIKGTSSLIDDNRVHLHIFMPSEGHAHIADLPQNTLIHITYYKLDPCDGVVKPLMGFVSAKHRSVASLCKPFLYQFVGKEVDQLIVLSDNSMLDYPELTAYLLGFKYQLPKKKLIGVLANTAMGSESCMNDPNSCWPSAWELPSDCFDAIDKATQTTKQDPKTVMFVPDNSVLVLSVKALRSSKVSFSARFMEAVVRAYRISGYQKSSIGLPDLLNAFILSNPKEFQLLPSVWRIAITSKEENTYIGKASKCDEVIAAPSCPHQSYNCLNGRKSRIYWSDTVYIITRTARRPKFFQNCYDSVARQSYPNIVHLVVTDNPEDEGYIQGKNVQYQVLESQARLYDPLAVCSMCSLLGNNLTENCTVAELVGSYFDNGYTLQDFLQCYCSTPYPVNKYIDAAQKMAGNGWILVLDDDNKLVSDYAISEIMAHVSSKNRLLIWRSCLTEVAPTPNDRHFGISIDMGAIDTSSFMYHSKFAGYSKWKLGLRCGDYWTASSLQKVLKPLWIDNVFVQAQTGRFGYGAGSDFDEKDVSINLEECLTHAKF